LSEVKQPNEDLIGAIRAIRKSVREHRDQVGDYRCWVDDEVLYHRTLPELINKTPAVPSKKDFADYCESYFCNRQDPSERETEIPLDSSVGPLEFHYDKSLDNDLKNLGISELQSELDDWYSFINKHRLKGQRDRTFEDDKELYMRLPERKSAITKLPPKELFIGGNCPAYNKYCQDHPEEFAEGLWKK